MAINTTNVVMMFKPKKELTKIVSVSVPVKKSEQILVEEWQERNRAVSAEFSLNNAYQKQQVLDTVLQINDELYKLVFDLRAKLKEKGIE